MKWIFRFLFWASIVSVLVFLFYFNNLSAVDSKTVSYYKVLKTTLRDRGYNSNLLVISTKRFAFHNNIQVKYSGAASKSRHLKGDAIDFLVLDVNDDGKRNAKDVDIVTAILDNEIMKDKGGIGTYKNERSFIDRQMIHIDCREKKTRWSR